MTELQNIFSDFIKLSYNKSGAGCKKFGIRDIKVVDMIISRISDKGCNVIYLNSGNQFYIPQSWIDLFSSLSTHSGEEVGWVLEKGNEKDQIDCIIQYMINIDRCISRGISRCDSDLFLETLGNIYSCGTEKFRKWCKSEFDMELEPIEFISLNENIEI